MPQPESQPTLFLTTRWSVVLMASQGNAADSGAALQSLCLAYWYPLYLYVRSSGHPAEDAQDLTQEFFARLLEKNWLASACAEKGRFRTFLLVALKRFMAKEWRRATALKRGGPLPLLSLDTTDAESRYAREPASALGPDEIFERRWAMTLLEQALARLEAEFRTAGKAADFVLMKDWLSADRGGIPYDELAPALKCSTGAARVAMHRMRQRFRGLFREAVANTLEEGENIDDELRHLVGILSTA